MTILGQISSEASNPEKLVGALGILVVTCFALWRAIQWFNQSPRTPDPWDAQVAEDISQDEAVPLCHRCLCPQSSKSDFCSECGAPVGEYTNWLPFPQLFSIGHLLRIGTFGEFKRSPLTVMGFWFFGLVEYTLFAPVYWFMLLRNRFHPEQPAPTQGQPTETLSGN